MTAAVVREDNLAVGMISTASRNVFSEVVEVIGVLAMAPTAAARFTMQRLHLYPVPTLFLI
jgi:hypothetical protein